MSAPGLKYWPPALAMLLVTLAAWALTPRERVADERPGLDLQALVPQEFADWRLDARSVAFVNPELPDGGGARLYSDVLSRNYVNERGDQIMLTIAYGADQSDSLRLHRPEICYAAQGFSVTPPREARIAVGGRMLPVRRLEAVSGPRHEPITYWMVVGDRAVSSMLGRKLQQLRYALTGQVPDGVLVRVSSIQRNEDRAYALHERFIGDLRAALDDVQAAALMGPVS